MSETRGSKLETRGRGDSLPGYMRLDAWRLSDELALQLFHVTSGLPAGQRWLQTQMMRAAVSVPANIAEGYSHASNRELLQFLSVARGSLAEVEYYLHFLNRTQLIGAAELEKLRDLAMRAGQTLYGLMKSVRSDLPAKPTDRRYLRDEPEQYDAAAQ